MNIDPKTMSRYQSKAQIDAVQPEDLEFETFTEDEEGQEEEPSQFREYQNPIHTEDEELLPGLFSSDLITWKQQYGDIFDITVKEKTFIIRCLERFEYKEIIMAPGSTALTREEMMCEYCVLYPQGYDFAKMANDKAGYPAVLSEFIMDLSGFTKQVTVRKL